MDGVSNLSRIGATLSDVGAAFGTGSGGNVAGLQRDALARQAALQAADLKKSFEASIKDPQELAFYRAAPDAYLKAKAKAFEPISVAGGNTVLNGPTGTFTAPKLVDDAGIYGTQGATGYTQTGARGGSIAETEAERATRCPRRSTASALRSPKDSSPYNRASWRSIALSIRLAPRRAVMAPPASGR
jgi:hypothetical protein